MRKIIIVLLLFWGCREKYVSSVAPTFTGYLVVEGFIDLAGTTTIGLTRTQKVADSSIAYETKAVVSIQGQNGINYPLAETARGMYTGSYTLPGNSSYRLRILTTAGKEYLSEYSPPRTTPAIDSITWERNTAGVRFSVHAHGNPSQEKYYQWKTEETYEYHATYYSRFKWLIKFGAVTDIRYYDPINMYNDTTTFVCWRTENSSALILGSTQNLSDNLIQQPLLQVPAASVKMSVLYSLNIKQYSLSKKAFEFLENMKKNTQLIGTVFDPQPSEIPGNLYCVTTPGEPVIGFVEVTQEQQRRIFISAAQVPDWNFKRNCLQMRVGIGDSIANDLYGYDTSYLPIDGRPGPGGFAIVTKDVCVDCRRAGGSTKKPPFWP
jgi:hypothetical protein